MRPVWRGIDRRLVGAVGAVAATVFLLALSNVGALHAPAPHHVPVGVVGPDAAVAQLTRGLATHAPGAFSVRRYGSEAAATRAILERDVYGAAVLRANGATLLVASAASPTVSSILQAALGPALRGVSVRDLRPLPASDSRGQTAFAMVIGLLIGSVMVTVVVFFLAGAARPGPRAVVLTGFAVVAAVLVVIVAYVIIGALSNAWLGVLGLCALFSVAITLPIAGAQAFLGLAGTALGALAFLVIGNAASGGPSAPELLPGFWHAVSQLLPPGAVLSALRNTIYFNGHRTAGAILTLALWALLGLILIGVAGRRATIHRDDDRGTAPRDGTPAEHPAESGERRPRTGAA